MKFSITSLEQARKNPAQFAKLLKRGDSPAGRFGGYPKSMRWLNAVCAYHKSGNITEAFDSIEKAFSNRRNTPRNKKEVEKFLRAIDSYRLEIEKRKLSLIKSREPINIALNPQIRISGIVPIILMKPLSGFSAFFIEKYNPLWQSELRFPIIQFYIADKVLNTSTDDISVGYIDYLTGQFYENSFSKSEIKRSRKEVETIGQTILLSP